MIILMNYLNMKNYNQILLLIPLLLKVKIIRIYLRLKIIITIEIFLLMKKIMEKERILIRNLVIFQINKEMVLKIKQNILMIKIKGIKKRKIMKIF